MMQLWTCRDLEGPKEFRKVDLGYSLRISPVSVQGSVCCSHCLMGPLQQCTAAALTPASRHQHLHLQPQHQQQHLHYSIQTPAQALALTTTISTAAAVLQLPENSTCTHNLTRKTIIYAKLLTVCVHLWKFSHVSGPKVGRGFWENISIFTRFLLIFCR